MRSLLIVCTFLAAWSSFCGRFAVCDEPSRATNTIANRLAGTWAVNRTLSDSLGFENYKLTRVRFTNDPSTLVHFPEFDRPEDFCVYLIGTIDLYGENREQTGRPFVLTSIGGMPYIYWLETFGNDGFDGEAFQVGIFSGSDPSRDILGLGDDHYSEDTPMLLFNRVNE